jgi:hypothetical protein
MAPVALRLFFVVGPLFAAWAVVISVVGFVRADFPHKRSTERAVIGISAALLLAVILSATIGAKFEHKEEPKAGAEAPAKAAEPTP